MGAGDCGNGDLGRRPRRTSATMRIMMTNTRKPPPITTISVGTPVDAGAAGDGAVGVIVLDIIGVAVGVIPGGMMVGVFANGVGGVGETSGSAVAIGAIVADAALTAGAGNCNRPVP